MKFKVGDKVIQHTDMTNRERPIDYDNQIGIVTSVNHTLMFPILVKYNDGISIDYTIEGYRYKHRHTAYCYIEHATPLHELL